MTGGSYVKPIDVVMLTKNSERILHECLKSIYENVPVEHLIIVDGSSTDSSLEIVRELNEKYQNIDVITENGSRAKARQVGIHHVRTPWFMFVDSDVMLCKDWAERAEKCVKANVGAVWGLNIDVIPNMSDRFLLGLAASIAKECFKVRGGMHDTLIRSELVKDIKIPQQLHTYEDRYITNWIKQKGFKVISTDEAYCLHYGPNENLTMKKSLAAANLEIRCGLVYSHTFKYALYYPLLTFYWMLRFVDQVLKQ
jgi:glycosyltransferase involved in cell wall biosynthesis